MGSIVFWPVQSGGHRGSDPISGRLLYSGLFRVVAIVGVILLEGDYCILIKNTCRKVNIGINLSLVDLSMKITMKHGKHKSKQICRRL